MDYRVSYEGHTMIVSVGHAHEPIRVDGEATIYSVSDGGAKVDQCVRLAMRALWACQIVESEDEATSTDCVIWDDVEYEPIRSQVRTVGYIPIGEVSYYVIRSIKGGTTVWDGAATSPEAALDAMARDAGYRDFATACEDSLDDGSHLVVEVVS